MNDKKVKSISDKCYCVKPLSCDAEDFLYGNIFTNPDIMKKERNVKLFNCNDGFKYMIPGMTKTSLRMFDIRIASIRENCVKILPLWELFEDKMRI